VVAKQVLYHMRHILSLFCFSSFLGRVLVFVFFLPGAAWAYLSPPPHKYVPLRQARIRKSSRLLQNTEFNIVFQIEHSSISLRLLFNCKYVQVIHTLAQGQLKPRSPGLGPPMPAPLIDIGWESPVFPFP
jgi:hypothetical protein